MTLIVGFGNKARSGKDAAGEAVLTHFTRSQETLKKHLGRAHKPYAVKLYKFAEALYRECRELHGMVEKDSPLLQNVGLQRRKEDESYWICKVSDQITTDNPDLALITDVRFKNEANFIKHQNGVLINVRRLNSNGSLFIASDRSCDHPSETELDYYPWDHFITAHTGESALAGQLAITIVEYEKGLRWTR